jgi:predicted nucleic acid-binding protein
VVFVLDASVTLSWCFADEQTPYSLAVLDRLGQEQGVVPAHWPMEVATGLLVAERRRRLTGAEVTELIRSLRALSLILDDATQEDVLTTILELARSQDLTVYDAVYLDLALRQSLPLASQDTDLRSAADRLGVTLI